MKTKKRKGIVLLAIVVAATIFIALFINKKGNTDIIMDTSIDNITVTSTAFEEMGIIPARYTADGEDISPDLNLVGLSDQAVSIAIIMDDLDVPWAPNFTHWVIWNIPAQSTIPEAVSHGEIVSSLDDARQGIAYGKHYYRGPNPPFGSHRYQFHVFVLDSMLDLESTAKKADLLRAMEGHILQYGYIIGNYK